MGRHPKPTVIKLLEGNPGKRPLPESEPTPPPTDGPIAKPKWLKGIAAKVWAEYAPIIEGMGLLTTADVETFARWCSLAAEFRQDPEGFTASRMARMDSLEARFGLDPSARARLGSAAAKKPKVNAFRQLNAG